MCAKVPYDTRSAAVADAEFIRKQNRRYGSSHKKIGKKLRPYRCLRCGFWHLTTQKQK